MKKECVVNRSEVDNETLDKSYQEAYKSGGKLKVDAKFQSPTSFNFKVEIDGDRCLVFEMLYQVVGEYADHYDMDPTEVLEQMIVRDYFDIHEEDYSDPTKLFPYKV